MVCGVSCHSDGKLITLMERQSWVDTRGLSQRNVKSQEFFKINYKKDHVAVDKSSKDTAQHSILDFVS